MSSTFSALIWSGIDRVANQGLQLVLSVVMARLLAPTDFGLVGMVAVFVAVAGVLADGSLGVGLVQRKQITEDDIATVFYLNVAAGVMMAGMLCVMAPGIAAFFRQPVLIPVTCALAVSCIISGFSIVPWALLTRGTDFRTQTWINTSSAVVSGAIGIWLAYAGKGVWSLVAQRLISSGMSMLLLWGHVGRLRGRFRWQSFREIWSFSSSLLASNLLTTVVENAYNVVIGRFYQPADLGQYNRAMTLAYVPSATLGHIVVRVSVPVLSRLQDDVRAVKTQCRRFTRLLALVAFPVMVAMALLAKPLVLVLLTDKWLPAVAYLQILSLALLFYPITMLLLNGLVALGRSGVFLSAEVLKRAMQIIILAVTFRSGVIGIVWGMLVLSVVGFLLSGACARSYLSYRWREQIQDLMPALGVCLVMAAGILLAEGVLEGCGMGAQLCLQALVGGGLYVGLVFAGRHGWFSPVFDEMKILLQRLKNG